MRRESHPAQTSVAVLDARKSGILDIKHESLSSGGRWMKLAKGMSTFTKDRKEARRH